MKKQKKVASKNLTPKNLIPHNICIDEAGHENVLCKVGLQRKVT